MLKIELSAIQFHSFHGVLEEERNTGGNFEVNLIVYFEPTSIPVLHIHETIDYIKLYEIVKLHMDKPTPLLETLATVIVQDVFNTFHGIKKVMFAIKKLNPPIPFFNGSVSVEYTMKEKPNKE